MLIVPSACYSLQTGRTYNVKPLDTLVYWLDDVDANDRFCEEALLVWMGQYISSALSAVTEQYHDGHSEIIVEPVCGC